MVLIIFGGMGFLVWDDLLTHGKAFGAWRLHSKIVIVSTSVLFLAGAVGFYITEYHHAFADHSGGEKLLLAGVGGWSGSVGPAGANYYVANGEAVPP